MKYLSRLVFSCSAFACLLVMGLPVEAQVTGLSFRPVDAAYSVALDRIILVSANPNQLHIYDPVAQSDQTVALSDAPQNLSLSSDGTHAAVALTNAVVYVDLQNAVVSNTFSGIAVGTGKVICGSGYIYVFPSYDGNVLAVNIATAQVTTANTFTYASGGTFNPAVNAIYSTENGISPNSLNRFDTSAGTVGSRTSEPPEYWGNFNVCGPLWLSHDGSIIYSACGTVYRASTDASQDMRYLGTLQFTGTSHSLDTSDSLNQIAVVPAVQPYSYPPAPLADTVVNLYSSSSFNPVGQFATTPFHVSTTDFPAHGRWVFYNSSSSAMFIITQADSSAGLVQDYAIEDVNLTNSNSCNATFGTASTSAMAAGSYATEQILSGEDCVYTAVSNVPWIVLSSGYYGSGKKALTYLVRPNLSTTPRSGTISIGTETFTVNQDGAGTASSLNPLSFKPVAAEYDNALDKIIMVSVAPNELHIYDPVSQADQIVPLIYAPLSVSVRPDGLFAAVGHSGKISIVDLQAQTVSQTLSVDMDSGGIALAGNGYVYAFPNQIYSFASIKSVQLSTGTLNSISDAYYGNIPRLDASGNYLYVSSLGSGSSKINISNGPATVAGGFFGTLSGNIWLSQDGNRLISSSGKVFFTSTIAAQDLQPDGQLSVPSNAAWAADSQSQQKIAVLTDPGTSQNTQLQLYATNGLQLESQLALPGFSNDGSSYISHGKYVFWNTAASKLFAITEADSSSGLLSDYAVYTVDAPNSLPGCTYSVSPASLNVPPSYSYSWTFNVTSNCSWRATTPNGSWFSTNNFSAVSGNGSFLVYVQGNSGGARSGTIAVGNQTVTINQAASTCSYTLSLNNATFSQSGGIGQVNLTTDASCPWSVQSNSPWMTVTGRQSGTGPAAIQFSVAPNAGSPAYRYGTLSIGGATLSIAQTLLSASGFPELTVSPTSLNFGGANVLTPNKNLYITVSNPNTQAIPTGKISINGPSPADFTVWTNCGASVSPGTSCSVGVSFSPLLVGSAFAVIAIPVAADGTEATVSVNGFGELDGAFEILSMPTGKVLEVPGGSISNGDLIAQNALNGFQHQQWQFFPAGGGYYYIRNVITGKVLDVTGGDTENGALIQQWDYLSGANQQWRLVPVDDVHYAIINRNSGLALDVRGGSTSDGASIQQWAYLGNPQQLWVLEPVQSYAITNSLSSYALDVTDGAMFNGASLQQWTSNASRPQQWQLVPVGGEYFAILNRNSGKVLDVAGGSNDNGASIQQWDYLRGANQQWQIVPIDGTTGYKIVNRQSGYVLDDTGYSITAGTGIQQWEYSGNRNQQWQIIPVTYYNIINRNSGQVLDVTGGSTKNGASVQQWSSIGNEQQQWAFLQAPDGNFMIVNNLSDKALDVTNRSTANGALLQQWDYVGGANQKWQLFPVGGGLYQIKNVNSGKVLDVRGADVHSGARLQQWDYLGGANQQWQLVPVN